MPDCETQIFTANQGLSLCQTTLKKATLELFGILKYQFATLLIGWSPLLAPVATRHFYSHHQTRKLAASLSEKMLKICQTIRLKFPLPNNFQKCQNNAKLPNPIFHCQTPLENAK